MPITPLSELTRIPVWTQGDRLTKARETARLSQEELAHLTGLSRQTISNYERDAVVQRRSGLNLWAMATGVPVEWLVTGEYTPRDLNPEPTDYGFRGSWAVAA